MRNAWLLLCLGLPVVGQAQAPRVDVIAREADRRVDVTIDGVSVGAVAGYTFSDVTNDHSIAATFATHSKRRHSAKRSWRWRLANSP